jgi:hypothetical protein
MRLPGIEPPNSAPVPSRGLGPRRSRTPCLHPLLITDQPDFADDAVSAIHARHGERFGSGDGEREASMTRQMPYEPLPASVLFALGWSLIGSAVMQTLS